MPKVDLMGFSMGGMTAQTIAVEHPIVVNKSILAGTQSSYTEGMVVPDPAVMQLAGGPDPNEEVMMKLFFYPSETSKTLGYACRDHPVRV